MSGSRPSQSSLTESKKVFKMVQNLNPYDKLFMTFELTPDCEAQSFLGAGSYGRVYGGKYKRKAVLKAYAKSQYSENDLNALVERMNILHFNPAAHIVNVYQVRTNYPTRIEIIVESCTRSLKQQLRDGEKDVKSAARCLQMLKFIDQIVRGVLHLHSLGISIGKLNVDKIFVQNNENVKILKVAISRHSTYQKGFLTKSSLSLESMPKQFILDMKMLAQLIIKLLYNKDFDINHPGLLFKPEQYIDMDKDKVQNLVYLINQALQGRITSTQFHKKYNTTVYKPKPKEILEGIEPLLKSTTDESEKQSDYSVEVLASSFVDAVYSKQQQNIDLAASKFKENYGNGQESLVFLQILESIVKDQTK